MAVNQFKIRSNWKPRVESPEELGVRTLRSLDSISALSPFFRDWEFLDLFRDPFEMTEENIGEFLFPLEQVRSQVTEIVKRGVRKDDFDRPDPGGGYGISVSNSNVPDAERVTLSANGGAPLSYASAWREACFRTDSDTEPDPAIVAYPLFKSVLLAIVSSWNVDFAQAFSSELVSLWETAILPFCDLSWMVYLSAPLATRIVIPTDVVIERTDDGGLLMIAAEETFDAANPAHIAAARSIVAALEPLNAELAKERAKFETWRRPDKGNAV
ncbi:MAG: Imm52 family immunity protein [Rhizomicrobium sp.]|jgi:hypothetical protein